MVLKNKNLILKFDPDFKTKQFVTSKKAVVSLANGYFLRKEPDGLLSILSPDKVRITEERFERVELLRSYFKVKKRHTLWGVLNLDGSWILPLVCKSVGIKNGEEHKYVVTTNHRTVEVASSFEELRELI